MLDILMPIEFHCQSCNRLMRTPDTAAGKKGKCPHCGVLMDIPEPSSPTPSSHAPAQDRQPVSGPAQGDAKGKIEFPCPKCGLPVRTPASVAGKKGKCPNCSAVVEIPLQSAGAVAAEEKSPRRSDKENLPVGGAYGSARTAPERRPTEASVSASRPSAPEAKAESSTAKAKQIQFHCPRCKRLIRTPIRALGKRVKCPGCGAMLSIPSRTSGKRHPQTEDPAGLTPLPEAKPGLTPLDEMADLIPLNEPPGLVPLDETSGLVPLDDGPGLTPLESGLGLTPIEDDPLASAATYEGHTGAGSSLSGGGSQNPLGNDFGSAASSAGTLAVNPYQSPTLAPSGYAGRRSKRFSRGVVVAPAVAMLVVLSLNSLVMIPYLIFYMIGAANLARAEHGGDEVALAGFMIGSIVGALIVLGVYILMFVGAWKMMKLQSYGLALTSAILMLVPCTFCWLGLPFGIWALVVLCLRDVRESFS
jgi:predicted RNA-binding Zn-ribbon protein involved in translation (DUF1610 family)